MRILLIIPAFNEEANILKVVREIEAIRPDIDYVVVDDCSEDNTLKILRENNINHLHLPKNLGIGGAVQTGFQYAYENDYDIAIQFDGDGQHDVRMVEKLCEPIIRGEADMVIGSRYIEKSGFQSTKMRRLGITILSAIIRITNGKKITDPTSGFRAINREVLKIFKKTYPVAYPEPESSVAALRKKKRIVEVPVEMRERMGGKSSINFIKSADYMMKVSIAIIIDKLRPRN